MRLRVFLPNDAYVEIDTGTVLEGLEQLPQEYQETLQTVVRSLLGQFADRMLLALDLDAEAGSQGRAVDYMASMMEELVKGVSAISTSQRG